MDTCAIQELERFQSKLDKVTKPDCWLWTSATHGNTPYFFYDGRSCNVRTLLRNPPLDKWVVPTCGERLCVNPDHLAVYTSSELRDHLKQQRSESLESWGPGSYQLRRTHCPQGHAYDSVNTYRWRNERRCRACARAHRQRLGERRRGDQNHQRIYPHKRSPEKAATIFGVTVPQMEAALKQLPPLQAEIFRRYWGFDRTSAQSCRDIGRELANYTSGWASLRRIEAERELIDALG